MLNVRAKLILISLGSLEPQLHLSCALYTNPIHQPGFTPTVPELSQNLSMNLLGAGGVWKRDGSRATSCGKFARKPETR